jgi:hypothetical protein
MKNFLLDSRYTNLPEERIHRKYVWMPAFLCVNAGLASMEWPMVATCSSDIDALVRQAKIAVPPTTQERKQR